MAHYVDSGILFRNRDKKESKHPDYRGELTVLCEHCGQRSERPLAAWLRQGRNTVKFLTLSCKPRATGAATATASNDDDDFLS
jgi:hypothetical protein